jgi:uncharacterized membrane protein YbhN (UPF0104 family)
MNYKALIKILVSIAMLALVLSVVNFDHLKQTLLAIPPYVVVVVTVGYLIGQLISSYKWWLIATSGRIDVPWTLALKAYFLGMYANCFGLGLVGGDLVRGVLIADGKPYKTEALASVIADRAHGLATLALLGTLAVALFGHQALEPKYTYILVGLGGLIVTGWFVGPWIALRLTPTTSHLHEKLQQVNMVFPKAPRRIIYITMVSILFHLVQITLHRFMGIGLGIYIPWSYLLVAIPFVNIVSSLPISWMGLGVRENAYVFFLANTGVISREQAVALGAIWLAAVTISSAVGGVVSFVTKDLAAVEAASE